MEVTISPLNFSAPDGVLDGDVVGCGFLVVEDDLERLVRGRRDRCRRELEVLGDHDDRVARRGGGGRRGRGRAGVEPPDPPEQAAVMTARATRPRPRTRRFIGSGLLGRVARPGWLPAASWRQAPAPSARRPVTRPAKEASSRLTTVIGVAVHPGEVDGDQDDQRDFDGLGDVGRLVVRALDRPAEDGRWKRSRSGRGGRPSGSGRRGRAGRSSRPRPRRSRPRSA